jgi:hypothetical protein
LTRVSHERGDRGEQHEIIEPQTPGDQVEVFRARDFWRKHAGESLLIQTGDYDVVEHHCRMHDAYDRRHCCVDFFEQPLYRAQIRDVAGLGEYFHAQLRKSL